MGAETAPRAFRRPKGRWREHLPRAVSVPGADFGEVVEWAKAHFVFAAIGRQRLAIGTWHLANGGFVADFKCVGRVAGARRL